MGLIKELDVEPQLKRMFNVMTDEIGIAQHSDLDTPLLKNQNPYPYSIDDVARALIVCSRFSKIPRFNDKFNIELIKSSQVYLDYILRAERNDGLFNNYQDSKGVPIVENQDSLRDCFGRVLWGLEEVMESDLPKSIKVTAEKLFFKHLGVFDSERVYNDQINTPHSRAFSLIALSKYLSNVEDNDKIHTVAGFLASYLELDFLGSKNVSSEWDWFDDKITYCAARLPHSMVLYSRASGNENILGIGMKTLDFLKEVTFGKSFEFNAVGNDGFYSKDDFNGNERPPRFDQQPIEAACMAEACSDIGEAVFIGNNEYSSMYGRNSLEWFRGMNINRVSMLSPEGGVYDALTPQGVNKNQGAESLVGYLMAVSKFLN